MMVVVEKKGRCTSTAAVVVRSYDQVSSPNFFNIEMSSSICAPNSLLSYTQLKSIPNSLHSQPLKRSSSLITRASLSTPKETVLKSFSERRALKIISGLQNFNKDNVASVVTAADKKLQPNFLDLMLKHLKPEPFDRQLRDAFKVIDKDCTGYAVVADLKHILTCIGEKLEPAEFDEWIREVDVGSDGKIKYEDFIARMVAK